MLGSVCIPSFLTVSELRFFHRIKYRTTEARVLWDEHYLFSQVFHGPLMHGIEFRSLAVFGPVAEEFESLVNSLEARYAPPTTNAVQMIIPTNTVGSCLSL